MQALTALDHNLFFAVHHLQRFHLDFLLAWSTYLGTLWFALPFLLILTLLKSRQKILARYFAAAFPVLLTHQSVELIKNFFKRPRPFTIFAEDPRSVNVLFDPPATYSFPSGHAATAFALAFVLSAYFKVPRAMVFGLAVLICLTRLYIGVHFPSDVACGALWGLLITQIWFLALRILCKKNS